MKIAELIEQLSAHREKFGEVAIRVSTSDEICSITGLSRDRWSDEEGWCCVIETDHGEPDE